MGEKTHNWQERSQENLAVFLDLEGKVLYLRGAGAGLTLSQAAGRHFQEWVPEDYRPALTEAIASAGAQRQAPVLFPLDAGGGRRTWWSGRIGPVRRSGQTVELLLVAKNVTCEQETKAEQERRKVLAEAVGDVLVCLIDAGPEERNTSVDRVLARLGAAAEAERTYLLRLESGAQQVDLVGEWYAPSAALPKVPWQGLAVEAVAGAAALMAESSPVWSGKWGGVDSVGQGVPRGWRVLARVQHGAEVWGYLGMDRPQAERPFSAEDRHLLQTAAAGLERALNRWAREEARRQQEAVTRLQGLGRAAGRLARDLEAVCTAVDEQTDFLLARIDQPYFARLEDIDLALHEGHGLCRRLWAAAEARHLHRRQAVLAGLMERVIQVQAPQWHCRIEPELWRAEIDSFQVEETLHRLCRWAREMPVGDSQEWCFSAANQRLDASQGRRLGLPPGAYVRAHLAPEPPGETPPQAGEEGALNLELAAVYQVIRAHGGTLETATGPSVIFYLPALDAPRSVPDEAPSLQGTAVLLLEPRERMQPHAQRVLQALGCRPRMVGRSQDAVQALQQEVFPLVILDLDPADGSVVDIVAEIRALRPAAKVLLTSSSARHPALAPLLQQGCAGWIGKPFRVTELDAAIREALGGP